MANRSPSHAAPQHDRFLDRLESEQWEPEFFAFLNRYLDRETVFIDIGGWIGVTPFWAAQSAKRVIAVEPDPICQAMLSKMHDMNPGDVTIHNKAVANGTSLRVGSVEGFGSSKTSALASGGEGVEVEGVTIAVLLEFAGDCPVCMKVDVEGFEYELIEQFRLLDPHRVRAIRVAMHPQFLALSMTGNVLSRRIRTAVATWRLGRSLKAFKLENRATLWRLVVSCFVNKKIRFRDLVFASPFAAPR